MEEGGAEWLNSASDSHPKGNVLPIMGIFGFVVLLIFILVFIIYLWKSRRSKNKGMRRLSEDYINSEQNADIISKLIDDNDYDKPDLESGNGSYSENEKEEVMIEDLMSNYELEANPQTLPRREWVKYLTGIPEPELREGDNIKGVIRSERVDKYDTYRFTFVNKYTKVEYDAGYFYTDSIGNMQKEFEMRPGDKGVFRSCKFIAELRQDYVTNGINPIHLHSQLLFLSPFLEIDQVCGRCVHAVSA